MNRLVFFLILSATLILLDLYAYQGLKTALIPFSAVFQKTAKALFWSLSVITLLGFVFFQPLSENPKTRLALMIIMTIGVANILGKLLFAIWILVADLVRLAQLASNRMSAKPSSSIEESTITRSQFLLQAGAITATIPMVTMGWGILSGAHDYRVLKRTVRIPGLPKSFDGLSITHISDIHMGSFWSKKAVSKGVELVNEQRSDIIFFTGDLVNNTAEELNGWTDLFSKLKAERGVYSVLGNHDYGDYVQWPSAEAKQKNLYNLITAQKQMGWDLLINENREIQFGADSISIVGIENWGAKGRFPKYGDMQKALVGTENSSVKLLLSHDPSHWREEVIPKYQDINMMFSGHTHGMQFGIEVGSIKWSPVKYFYPEWADLYTENDQFLYVNRGFGYIGYPGRFGILPEITVITLVS